MSPYSVVIPAYNASKTTADALESILQQTILPVQIVVVDDGSVDNTASEVSKFGGPVRLIKQTNQGPGAATSHGIRHCLTPLVATLDADDLWLPQKMIDWIAKGREAGFQFTHLAEVLARRRVWPGSLSFERDATKDRGYLHVARAALLRKRSA